MSKSKDVAVSLKPKKKKTENQQNSLKIAKDKFKEKFNVEVNSECISCINAALNEEGYISDKEVYSIYEPYKDKKDKKYFMSMVNPHV